MLTALGNARVELGNYEEAIVAFESVPASSLKVSPNNLGMYYLLSNNKNGYYRVCDAFAKDISTPQKLNNVVWLCVLLPEAIHKYPEVQEEASKHLGDKDANLLNTLGAMYVRLGKCDLAVETLKRSIELRKRADPMDWYFLSLAYQGLGEAQESQDYSTKLGAWLNEQQLKRDLQRTTDPAFTSTLEHELKLFSFVTEPNN